MSPITEKSSLEDVCFAVCTALAHAGTVAVLTGGSAATYYAPHAYQSGDADFIITFSSDTARAGNALRELGYHENGGTYHHDKSIFTVEFPPGPLAIGNELVSSYDTVQRGREISLCSVPYRLCTRSSGFVLFLWRPQRACGRHCCGKERPSESVKY